MEQLAHRGLDPNRSREENSGVPQIWRDGEMGLIQDPVERWAIGGYGKLPLASKDTWEAVCRAVPRW